MSDLPLDPDSRPDRRTDETSDHNSDHNLEISVTDTQTVVPAAPTASLTGLPAHPTLPAHYTMADVSSAPDAPATAAETSPEATPPAPAPRVRRSPRVRTVVFGLVMLAISVVSLVALMTDIQVDGSVVGLGLLIGAGAALVAGGAAAAVREARGGPGAAR